MIVEKEEEKIQPLLSPALSPKEDQIK